MQKTDSIRPTAPAMIHLRHILQGNAPGTVYFRVCKRPQMHKGGIGKRNHGNTVHNIRTQDCSPFGDVRDVVYVDAGNDRRVDLDHKTFFLQLDNVRLLPGNKQLDAFTIPITSAIQIYPGVESTTDQWIDGVHRNRHIRYSGLC
jgi:hypothetical protein